MGGGTSVNEKYKVVNIQNLPPVDKDRYYYGGEEEKSRDLIDYWVRTKCDHYSWETKGCSKNCKSLCYMQNNSVNVYHNSNNAFYDAFVKAYNTHEDVILSPDDIWLCVCFQFSKYINDNSEAMRNKFVSHEGKKELTVTTPLGETENQWDTFFELIFQEIKKNTKDNITDLLMADFTSTTHIEEVMSVVTIMDSFKKYFDYGRCIPDCGINNVRFMGTYEDWTQLLDKIKRLESYGVTPQWTKYIQELVPIVEKFIDTYNGNVDVDFWNKIMNITHGRLGSGSTTRVSGWILKFFGLDGEVDVDDIKGYSFDVPVKVTNYSTGEKKTVNLVGGFGGVYKEDGAYRPQLSMIVYHDGNSELI